MIIWISVEFKEFNPFHKSNSIILVRKLKHPLFAVIGDLKILRNGLKAMQELPPNLKRN